MKPETNTHRRPAHTSAVSPEKSSAARGAAETPAPPAPSAPAAAGADVADAVIRKWRCGDEAAICEVIATCYGEESGPDKVRSWRWKHARRPGFAPDDVLVGEFAGRVIGCFHGWTFPLRVERDLEITAGFNGDWAVLEGFRGGALTRRAWKVSGEAQGQKGVLVRVGFATPAVNEGVYRRRFGCVFVPAATVRYRKPLGLAPLAQNVRSLGERALRVPRVRRALERRAWTVDFTMTRFPPFHIVVDASGFHLREGLHEDADLRVSGPFAVIAAVPDGPGAALKAALRHFVAGRLRVRGAVRSGYHLLRSLAG